MERRKHHRLPYETPVMVESVDPDTDGVQRRVVVEPRDISNGGLQGICRDSAILRDWQVFHPMLWATLKFAEFSDPVRIPVTIAWSRPYADSKEMTELGLQFRFPGGGQDFRLSFALARLSEPRRSVQTEVE